MKELTSNAMALEASSMEDRSSAPRQPELDAGDGSMPSLTRYLPGVFMAVADQLAGDKKRWGDTWASRPRFCQEARMYERLRDYGDQWNSTRTPLPYTKIIGECVICMVREALSGGRYKEYFPFMKPYRSENLDGCRGG